MMGLHLQGQTGDECQYAYFISDVSNYCSGEREFSNQNATPSSQTRPECWPDGTVSNDLWFAFTPKRLGVYISVKGAAQFSSGTLTNPSIALYSGTCGSLTELECSSDQFENNIVELTLDQINIGQIYYLRVDARYNNLGSFQLCIQEFNPAKAPEADCRDAVLLCDKSPFYVENLLGVGDVFNEVSGTCLEEEFASVWYKWICEDSGTLEFDITPNNISDDIDFVVYRLPGGVDDCAGKEVVRCMASGETIGQGAIENYPCAGMTGLSSTSNDEQEFPGCSNGSDNYVSAINMVEGETYMLFVNNYSKSGYGFSITFGGTGTFKGPEADFEAIALEQDFVCDKRIQFNNLSESLTDPIVSYTWNFGDGSTPSILQGEGPHEVTYNSFGDKIAALTVETSRGCLVTYVEEFFVEPCCDDNNTLGLEDPEVTDVTCFGADDGQIFVEGTGGNPRYLYSLNDGDRQPIPAFGPLSAGDYNITVTDIKGCEVEKTVSVVQPPEIIPDAGRDTTVQLGDVLQFFGSVTPPGDYTYTWTPDTSFNCKNCLDPEFFPWNTQTFVLTATDDNGCFGQDSVTVRVEVIREVDAPNIFSPNGDFSNEYFNVVANKAAVGIEELLVFDRWGNKVYTGKPELGDFSMGWDGMYNGKPVETGVYTWLAKVLFLDGVVVAFSGDITVVR